MPSSNIGPGKFSSIRAALAVAKGIHISNNAKLFGYNDADLDAEQNPDTDDQGNTIAEYLNAIKWSRFGNFAITKWSGSDWIE